MKLIVQSFRTMLFSIQTSLYSLMEAMVDSIYSLTFGFITWEKLKAIKLPVCQIPKAKDDGLVLWIWEVVPAGTMMLFGVPLALAMGLIIATIFFSFISSFMVLSGEIYRRYLFK